MTSIDIFYQGHGLREIEHIEVRADHTIAVVKAMLIEKHGYECDTLIFIEDEETPLGDHLVIGEICRASAKLHLHRCRHVEVAVKFAGQTVHHKFTPAATIGRIKTWAAVTKFGMTEEEAGEHLLQIAGTTDRPPPGTHVGMLVACPECRIAFDLVPDERVNGAPVAKHSESR